MILLYYKFDVEQETKRLIRWIADYFKDSHGKNAVIGMSGGKDSSIIATLCVKALGNENVYGVLMPDGFQHDIDDAFGICKFLQIPHNIVNIKNILDNHYKSIGFLCRHDVPEQILTNSPARIRMMTLYAVSNMLNSGRVINTCNLSEEYIGWFTKFGDSAGDCAPCKNITASEMIQIGEYLGLPKEYVFKVPHDGMCGSTDEDKFGFTYKQLDDYIRFGKCNDLKVVEKIKTLHKNSKHKHITPCYEPFIYE